MDFEPGGGGSEGVGENFQGGDPGSVVLQGGDVGTDPQDGSVPEKFSSQSRATAYWESSEETGGVGVGNTPNWWMQ